MGGAFERRAAGGTHDLLIAATALAVGYGVLTVDIRDFGRIPGLRVEIWGR